MNGKVGFEHDCTELKMDRRQFKKSLKDSNLSHAQINVIWDFYVTHALSGGTGLERSLEDYGWSRDDNKKTGYPAIEKALSNSADFCGLLCFIRAKRCDATLAAMDLWDDRICIEHPRAVMLRKYTVQVDENENLQFAGGQNSENNVISLFRHMRNAFAHANTYFFDNGMLLLEDKDGGKITAEILIKQQTLLDWIKLIDVKEKFYKFNNLCNVCNIKDK